VAAITLVDYLVLRRGSVDVADRYQHVGESGERNVNGPGLISLAVGIVAGWSWQNVSR
jgi:cytosine/uracil/thiamine/allantoin permease